MMAAVLAFGLTIALCPPVLACLRRWRLLDRPGSRSSHVDPTPRGGGIAPGIGASVALAASHAMSGGARSGLLAAALALGAIGLLEDAVGVPALRRLVLQPIAAALPAWWLLSPWGADAGWRIAAAIVVVLWIVSFVNAFNFMDGIDGISVTQTLVVGASWYLIGRVEDIPMFAAGSLIVASATLAFAPFNVPKARMFLGDAGSYFLGAWIAALAVIGLRSGLAPEAVLAPVSVYLADTGTTLVRRIRRGDIWHEAHRDHTYQRLQERGWTHMRTTLVLGAVMTTVSALGLLALTSSATTRVVGDALIALVLLVYLSAPTWLTRASHSTPHHNYGGSGIDQIG